MFTFIKSYLRRETFKQKGGKGERVKNSFYMTQNQENVALKHRAGASFRHIPGNTDVERGNTNQQVIRVCKLLHVHKTEQKKKKKRLVQNPK